MENLDRKISAVTSGDGSHCLDHSATKALGLGDGSHGEGGGGPLMDSSSVTFLR